MAALQVRRIAYALGAEVTGIDLRRELDDETIAEIRSAWLEHLVLFFPEQHLDKDEQLAFARRFGELERVGQKNPESPHLTLVSERAVNGRPWNGYKGGQVWHSDKSFTTHPTAATFLNCKEIPEVGGDTMFANQYMAYDALSPAYRTVVDGLAAIHDYELRLRSQSVAGSDARTPEEVKRAAAEQAATRSARALPTVHPVVRVHPETGRRSLYIGDRIGRLEGMSAEESASVLDFLKSHAVLYEFTYRHRWHVGDLLMWDNRCTLHIALCDYVLQRDPRFMLRCAVTGEESGYQIGAEALAASG